MAAGLVLSAAPALALAPSDADKSNTHAVTSTTAPLSPGQSGWLSVVWTSDTTVRDWSTTVQAPAGITVTYPSTRGGSDTSLYGSDTLVGSTRDFTSFKLKVPYTQTSSFKVVLTSIYTVGAGSSDSNGNGNNRKAFSTTATVTVPVQPATGADFNQQTTTLTVKPGSNAFQRIIFSGGQTDLAGFTVRLGTLPPGLEVAYPGDRSSTGLNDDTTLVGGSSDYVGVRFIATDLKPGRYTVPVLVNYTAAAARTQTSNLTLVVP
ncbi:hypothetical protein [Terrabacter sp. BE26]|uniref:hypothetical protein n=1 Tax=Terrabacter sp. BE26 TaxID=2898152 RepID=UPI0035BE3853